MPAPSLPRRTTVGLAGLGLLGVAGCGARASGPGSPAAPAGDPDVVERAHTALVAAETLVVRTMRRHPALRSRLRPLVTLHRRHDELLSPGDSADPVQPAPATTVPAELPTALATVLRSERALQSELTSLALRAESGPLARVLAAMAAGTAQRIVLLERT